MEYGRRFQSEWDRRSNGWMFWSVQSVRRPGCLGWDRVMSMVSCANSIIDRMDGLGREFSFSFSELKKFGNGASQVDPTTSCKVETRDGYSNH